MKKRILSIVSIMLIAIMLFSVVSCNSTNLPSPDVNDAGNAIIEDETLVTQPAADADEEDIDEEAVVIFDSTVDEDGIDQAPTDDALIENDASTEENGAEENSEKIPADIVTDDAIISGAAAQTPIKLRVGSYNIQHGAGDKTLKKIAANIKAQNLDIVALQEVDYNTNRSGKVHQTVKLAEYAGFKYRAFFKAIDHDGGQYGIAILSKYKFENRKVWDLPNGSYENRVLARVQIRVQGQLINFYATHLTYNGESAAMRKKQFAEIAKIVKSNSNFIIAGDFNTANFSEFNVLDNNTAKKTYTLNRTNHLKYTEPASKSAIDNIVFRNWTFGKPQVVTNSYSDHYMLWGEATFN